MCEFLAVIFVFCRFQHVSDVVKIILGVQVALLPLLPVVLDSLSPILLCHLVCQSLHLEFLILLLIVLDFVHQVLVMARSCLEHFLCLLLSHFLVSLSSRILSFKPFQSILHDLGLLLGFPHVVVIIKHHHTIVVHSSATSKSGQRNTRHSFRTHVSVVQFGRIDDF